jgi:hypothetical protein
MMCGPARIARFEALTAPLAFIAPNCSFRGWEVAFAEAGPIIGCGLGEVLPGVEQQRRLQLVVTLGAD